jgi:hypothetical protein
VKNASKAMLLGLSLASPLTRVFNPLQPPKPHDKGLKLLCCKAQRDKASAKKEALQ